MLTKCTIFFNFFLKNSTVKLQTTRRKSFTIFNLGSSAHFKGLVLARFFSHISHNCLVGKDLKVKLRQTERATCRVMNTVHSSDVVELQASAPCGPQLRVQCPRESQLSQLFTFSSLLNCWFSGGVNCARNQFSLNMCNT